MPFYERSVGSILAMAVPVLSGGCAPAKSPSADGLAWGGDHPLLHHLAPSFPTVRVDASPFVPTGKVLVLYFFATWSDPSRANLAKLEDLYAKYRSRGVDIIAIAIDDDRAAVGQFLRTYATHLPAAWDPKMEVVRHWLVPQVPASFVIDRRGVVRAAFVGHRDGFEIEIESDLAILTSDNSAATLQQVAAATESATGSKIARNAR